MNLTERDLELVRCISKFGFLTVEQVMRLWGVADFSTVAARVRKLVDAGYIERVAMAHFSARPLLLTKTGAALVGAKMQPQRGVRTATFSHDCMVFELALALQERFPGSHFATEREYRTTYPDHEHVPDGLLHLADGRKVAIELELTQKAPRRLKSIIDAHAAQLHLDDVWYVVRTEPMRTFVRRIAGDAPHIKVVLWQPKDGWSVASRLHHRTSMETRS